MAGPNPELPDKQIHNYIDLIDKISNKHKDNDNIIYDLELTKVELNNLLDDTRSSLYNRDRFIKESAQYEERVSSGVKTFITAAVSVSISGATFKHVSNIENRISFISSFGPLMVAIYFLITGVYFGSSLQTSQKWVQKRFLI